MGIMLVKANHVLAEAINTTVSKKAHRTAKSTRIFSHINDTAKTSLKINNNNTFTP